VRPHFEHHPARREARQPRRQRRLRGATYSNKAIEFLGQFSTGAGLLVPLALFVSLGVQLQVLFSVYRYNVRVGYTLLAISHSLRLWDGENRGDLEAISRSLAPVPQQMDAVEFSRASSRRK
jgi:hypothetical protein